VSTLLVVEDDADYRATLARNLADAGFQVAAAAGIGEARTALELQPDLALVDLRLADGDGIEVVRLAGRIAPACRCVVLTGHGTIPAAVEAMRAGAVDFRTKPVDLHELVQALHDALDPLPAASLEDVERAHILGVLQACGGNISEAARRLGLYRRTLQRKLQKLPPAR
jgi:two-component system, response regulator RegA